MSDPNFLPRVSALTTPVTVDPQFLQSVATQPGLSWQQRVSTVSNTYGVRANEAAQLLDPYYLSQRESASLPVTPVTLPTVTPVTPPSTLSVMANSGARGQPFNMATRESSFQLPTVTPGTPVSPVSPVQLPTVTPATQVSPVQLPTVTPVSPVSPVQLPTVTPVSPVSQRLTPQQSSFVQQVAQTPTDFYQKVKTVADTLNVGANEAAQALDPYVQSARESPRTPRNRNYFLESEVRKIAAALGLPTDGDKLTLVLRIRERIDGMATPSRTPRSLTPMSLSTTPVSPVTPQVSLSCPRRVTAPTTNGFQLPTVGGTPRRTF